MSTFTLELPTSQKQDTASWAAIAFIANDSSGATRRTYTTQLPLWMAWCADHHLDRSTTSVARMWSCTPESSTAVDWPLRRSR